MNKNNELRLILGPDEFLIPSTFTNLNSVNPDICKQLMIKRKYKVKSFIDPDIMQSFINYLVYKEVPYFTRGNIYEYEQLSNEFDIMKNLIQMFKKQKEIVEISPLLKTNDINKRMIKEKKEKLSQNAKEYQQIIHKLFNNTDNFLELQNNDELVKACFKSDVTFVDLLTRKKLIVDGILYVIDEKDKTAGVFRLIDQNATNIFIPKTVCYNADEYIVTAIHEKAFKNSKIQSIQFPEDSELVSFGKDAFEYSIITKIKIPSHVKTIGDSCFCNSALQIIEFADNSELKTIDKYAFFSCNIQNIDIPSSVIQIGIEAFCNCFGLQNINFPNDSKLKSLSENCLSNTSITSLTIPPNIKRLGLDWNNISFNFNNIKIMISNKNFICLDDKLIIGKTDIKSDNYDKIVFVRRDITEIIIPSFIKEIDSKAFIGCINLLKIKFTDDSQLETINSFSFAYSAIEYISIPANVKRIMHGAFFNCRNLKKVEIPINTKLESICMNAFSYSGIESITIPSDLDMVNGFLSIGTKNIKEINIIQKQNANIIYYDNKFVIGKFDLNSNIFDILYICRRDIESAIIPSFITKIAQNAFCGCSIKNIEFESDSQLRIIDNFAFASCSLEGIMIPSHVVHIGERAFAECKLLKTVEFDYGSELKTIDNQAFGNSALQNLSIPSSILEFQPESFSDIANLKNINIIQNDINNIIYFDEKYIIGKSDINSNYFDVILFARCDIKHAIIPPFIKFIGPYAFSNCKCLQTVDFSNNHESLIIDKYAFESTPLTQISIPSAATCIKNFAFYNCQKLTNVDISQNSKLTSIDDYAFANTSINDFYIPADLAYFGRNIFFQCFSLKTLEIDEKSKLRFIYSENLNADNIMVPIELQKKISIV